MHNFQSTRRRRSSRQVIFSVILKQDHFNNSQSDGDCDEMNRHGSDRTKRSGISLDTIEEKAEVSQ